MRQLAPCTVLALRAKTPCRLLLVGLCMSDCHISKTMGTRPHRLHALPHPFRALPPHQATPGKGHGGHTISKLLALPLACHFLGAFVTAYTHHSDFRDVPSIAVQEHKLCTPALPASTRAFAAKHGLATHLPLAIHTAKGGASSGTGFLWSKHLPVRSPGVLFNDARRTSIELLTDATALVLVSFTAPRIHRQLRNLCAALCRHSVPMGCSLSLLVIITFLANMTAPYCIDMPPRR
jgi:hypothetical protein